VFARFITVRRPWYIIRKLLDTGAPQVSAMKQKQTRKKARVAIIGTGNIGSDLLIKILRSPVLTCVLFTGKNSDSPGIKRAEALGVPVSSDSIGAILKNPDAVDIVFDATSADAHFVHAPILKKLHKFTIDLTPSRVGEMCVPILNLSEAMSSVNVNMISCGGQANTPLVSAIMKVHPETSYIEIVSSVASKSAGIGTRNNIDEYTQTTSDGVIKLAGAPRVKTIIILNPADPPIYMHNTIYAKIEKPNIRALTREINGMVKKIQEYVPGYRLVLAPVFENNRVTIMNEVIGRGDYLPLYAGNLDIINCASVLVAQEYAKRKL
jgi:acetaldehyde dehydrogenase (acetylating)